MTASQAHYPAEAGVVDELDEVLGELQQALAGEQRELRHVQGQWGAKEVRVVVLGEAKRGKSSLINALAGQDLLPTGIIPVTSVATVVRKDPRQCLRVDFRDGRQVFAPLGRIADYVSEEGNPGNRLGVEAVEALVPDLPWPESVLFVDTPGTGSVAAYHDRASSAAAGTMDVALVVVTADPPISAREEHQISAATARSAELLVALTKCDLVSADDLESVLRYTRRIVTSGAGRDVEIVSGRVEARTRIRIRGWHESTTSSRRSQRTLINTPLRGRSGAGLVDWSGRSWTRSR